MVDVVVGVRRCGKAYRLYQELQRLRDEVVPPGHVLYLNLEDDRLQAAGLIEVRPVWEWLSRQPDATQDVPRG